MEGLPDFLMLCVFFVAGLAAGVSNAIAGGGTFFTLPVFLAAGLPPVVASASNAIAVWPGHALAVVAYKKELLSVKHQLGKSIFIGVMGGLLGAVLLTVISNQIFGKLIPVLILLATLLFAFGKQMASFLNSRPLAQNSAAPYLKNGLELVIAIYGGFFGAAYGVMLMAWLQMATDHDLQTNNALKNLIATFVTSVAVLVFAVSGVVAWGYTIVAFIGAILGGVLGARLARKLSSVWLSRVIILFGLLLSAYYFYKYYA